MNFTSKKCTNVSLELHLHLSFKFKLIHLILNLYFKFLTKTNLVLQQYSWLET